MNNPRQYSVIFIDKFSKNRQSISIGFNLDIKIPECISKFNQLIVVTCCTNCFAKQT